MRKEIEQLNKIFDSRIRIGIMSALVVNDSMNFNELKELVDATYDAAERLNELKFKYGRLSRRRARAVAERILEARDLRARLEGFSSETTDPVAFEKLKGEISRFSISTVCDKRELFWQRHLFNFRATEILRIGGRYLGLGHEKASGVPERKGLQ